jgi:hypothetical protein
VKHRNNLSILANFFFFFFWVWLHMYFTIGTHGPLSWRTCFGHACTTYTNIITIWFESLCWFLRDQFKELQVVLQKVTTWTAKLGKGCIEWKIVTYLDTRLHHWKLKTWIKTKFINNVILFYDTLKNIDIPLICVMEGKKAKSCKVMCQIHT